MRSRRGRPASPAAEGAVIGALALAVYVVTRTRDVGGDDTVFAAAVDRWLHGHPEWPLFFHPHHMLYNPLVAAMCRLSTALGVHPFVLDVGAAVSAVCAAFAVGATVVLLRRSGVGEGVALLAATVLAFAGAYWTYATRMEVYALTAAGVVVWLAVVGRDEPQPEAAGAALAFAVLGHAAAGLLVVPTAWRLRRRPRRLASALAIGLGVPAVLLVLSFVLLEGRVNPASWLAGFAGGREYIEPARALAVLGGLRALLLWGFYHVAPVLRPAVVPWLDTAGWLALVVVAGLVAAGVVTAVRRRSPLALTALLAVGAYVPLWLVWDVGNPEHMVAAAPLLAVLAGFGASALPRRVGAILLAVAAVLLALVNGVASAVPQSRPENGRVWVTAEFVATTVPTDGVLLSAGRDPRLRLGLAYLSGRRVIDLTLAVRSARAQGLLPTVALAYWLDQAALAGRVWALPDVFDPATEEWVAGLGVPPAAWRAAVARLHPEGRRVMTGDGVAVAGAFSLTVARVAPAVGR